MSLRALAAGVLLALLGPASAGAQAIKELTGHRQAVSAVAFRPDGRQLCTASFDHTLRFWDAVTGEVQHSGRGHQGRVLALAYSADGQTAASAGLDGTLRLWNAGTGKRRFTLPTREEAVHALAFTPDGRSLL